MKVTYIYHSCFSIELNHIILVFDYFKGKIPDFDKNKNIYVFSSHKHHDHFSLSMFHEFEKYPKVKYILSNDIKLNEKYLANHQIDPSVKENIINVQANKEYVIDELKVETLKSTDLGVAFIVHAEEKTIYHAGDLNWWYWKAESEIYNTNMENKFKNELALIKNRKFDLAFLPTDSRQEEDCWLGFNYFMNITNTCCAFPMHFWEDYSVMDHLEKIAITNGYKNNVFMIEGDGQQWEV
ncbi:MAG: MBL fold metallo-hydrolase [Lachnotalea sp.]